MDWMAIVPRLSSFVLFDKVTHDFGFLAATRLPIVTGQIRLYKFENVLLNL